MLLTRVSGPSLDRAGRKPWIEVIVGPRLPARCSQWMPSSKNASPPAIVSSLRQSSGRLQAMRDSREMGEDHLADDAIAQQPPQA